MTHTPPEHLDQQAQRKWAEVFPILETRGDIDAGTLDALAAYAVAYSQWVQAQEKIAELGSVVKSAAGFAIVSPYVTVAAQAERRMRQWGDTLRLTPKSKSRKTEAVEESAVTRILRCMENDTEAA